jgi:dCTP deaminase
VGILNDTEMRTLVRAQQLVHGLDPSRIDDYVHGCAIEFHVGDIFVPGSKPGKLGSASRPRKDLPHSLEEGETAVITTLESFALDDKHTAVVFPVSSVSFKGLLMTNPGHVDPGFNGPLHVTVINMGKNIRARKGSALLASSCF